MIAVARVPIAATAPKEIKTSNSAYSVRSCPSSSFHSLIASFFISFPFPFFVCSFALVFGPALPAVDSFKLWQQPVRAGSVLQRIVLRVCLGGAGQAGRCARKHALDCSRQGLHRCD